MNTMNRAIGLGSRMSGLFQSRTQALKITFIGLVTLLALFQTVAFWPREPKLVFTNDMGTRLTNLRFSVGDVTTDLGPVNANERIVLPVKLRENHRCRILGEAIPPIELERLTLIARQERRDVFVAVDFHGCLVLEGWEINPMNTDRK